MCIHAYSGLQGAARMHVMPEYECALMKKGFFVAAGEDGFFFNIREVEVFSWGKLLLTDKNSRIIYEHAMALYFTTKHFSHHPFAAMTY